MKSMTVTDRRTLVDIIVDELNKHNNAIISEDGLEKEAIKLSTDKLGTLLPKQIALKKKVKKFQKELDDIEQGLDRKIEDLCGERIYHYGDDYTYIPELVKKEKNKLRVKYKLTGLPEHYDIEKEIVKMGNSDYPHIIHAIVKLFNKK